MEGAALAGRALCPNAPFVGEDDLLHQGKAKPGAADLAMGTIVYAKKFGEKERHGIRRYANPGISDGDERFAWFPPCSDGDVTTFRRVFHRIREKVREHLAKPAGVGVNG